MTTSINICDVLKQNTSSTEWKEVNVTPIDSKTVQTLESATVQQRTSKKGKAYLVCVLRLKDGSTSQMPLTRHWEFQRGDTLDISTITFCHLADDKKKLKTNTAGKPEVYIYGELE